MNVTILTDASYCSATGIGAWAVYAVSGRGATSSSGVFDKPPANSTQAEAWAVVNGVEVAFQTKVLQPGDTLVLRIDNTSVIAELGSDVRPQRDPMTWEAFRTLMEHLSHVQLRHIKGHAIDGSAASYSHRAIDMAARSAMRYGRRLRKSA